MSNIPSSALHCPSLYRQFTCTCAYAYMRISENHNSLGCKQPSRPRCLTITQCAVTCTCTYNVHVHKMYVRVYKNTCTACMYMILCRASLEERGRYADEMMPLIMDSADNPMQVHVVLLSFILHACMTHVVLV